jgi:anti-anti-sigma factor
VKHPLLATYRIDSCAVVETPEEIDLSSAEAVERQILNQLTAGTTGLVIDLTHTSYCSSHGIAALIVTYRQARDHGVWMCAVNPQRQVRKIVFELLGLQQVIPIYADVERALAARLLDR